MKTPRLNNLFDVFGFFPTSVFQTRLTGLIADARLQDLEGVIRSTLMLISMRGIEKVKEDYTSL
jgi:hypothetical protein